MDVQESSPAVEATVREPNMGSGNGTGAGHANINNASRTPGRPTGLSYKFQRLREKIRAAIASGELAGKLPGERALAKRFHVNAKTLSKALTDLAAEGLLDRSIGRGTYVKGSAPADAASQGRWLVLCDHSEINAPLVHVLRETNPELQVVGGFGDMRPSFLNQFAAVIDTASDTPESFLRDLVVRNIPVVAVNREPKTYSMHTVLMDTTLGAARLARDLLLAGHRRLAAVEPRESTAIVSALRQAAARYAPDATVESAAPEEVRGLVAAGVTGIVCGSCSGATHARAALERANVALPAQVSLAAVGCMGDAAPCSGYYCTPHQVADAIVGLLRDAGAARPATLWLAGEYHDLSTMAPLATLPVEESARIGMEGVLV